MNAIIQFMKKNYKILLVVLCLSAGLFAFNVFKNNEQDPNPEKDKLLLSLLTYVLEQYHYSPKTIDDNFSKGLYKDYLEALDPSKRYFLQTDIAEFVKYETLLDDQIQNKDLSFFELTYERLQTRMNFCKQIYPEITAKPFDFNIEETLDVDYEKLPYLKDEAALKERWRKQIKFSTLSSLVDKQKIEEDKKSKDAKYEMKSFEVLEKEARESTKTSLDDYFSFIKDLNKEDYFSVYINSITASFDPHTNYFAPEDKERFDMSMSGKLEGIGARLQKKNDYTEISELMSGGPAWRGKQLEAGDVVLKVAQGNEPAVDVVGMRIDDVVKKIKGPKGTEVKLTVKKVDGTIKTISIIRDIVEIEETYAKSSIVNKNGQLYGVIYLPKFYIDFENKDSRNAATDMAKEVTKLKAAGVKGIIVDVRDDGGGSLQTVVDIAGLFIEKGPIVQVKTTGSQKEVLFDRDKNILWDGPLVVMVNGFSASASEILAAAIQDYKRGIIMGSKQTYGKGTVQGMDDLNRHLRSNTFGDFGALKLTTQKFYRINGGSTQLEGVSSDIVMPDRYQYLKMGEKDTENALPWDKIDAAPYTVWEKTTNFNTVIANSKKRILANNQFKLIEENAKWIDTQNKNNVFSLSSNAYKAQQKLIEETVKKYKPLTAYKNNLIFNFLPSDLNEINKDESLKEKRKNWHEALSKDVYVEEALNVLQDLQVLK
jgi:carboxyl-terminal processing protease